MVEILSCNVQGSGPSQTTLLEIGAKRNVEVILVQEPRTISDRETITKHGYTIFEPYHTWGRYMKTLTYVRNDVHAKSIPRDNPDGHMTSIFLKDQNLSIHNIYRPRESGRDSWIHNALLGINDNRSLICGDFNRIGVNRHQFENSTTRKDGPTRIPMHTTPHPKRPQRLD